MRRFLRADPPTVVLTAVWLLSIVTKSAAVAFVFTTGWMAILAFDARRWLHKRRRKSS